MSESTGGPGPALAAHSKDASAPRQNPASEARPFNQGGEEALSRLQQVTDFVRGQPLVSMAAFIMVGIIARKLFSRG
jgi:hypothetical protein